MMNYIVFAITLLSCMHSAAFAANDNGKLPQTSPVPGVQTGKVTYISINKLTPPVRKMVEAELNEQPFGTARRFGEISDDAVIYMQNYHAQMRKVSDVEKNLTFKLADVSRAELKKYVLEGAFPEGPTKAGPWSSITRVFKRDDDVTVMLHEWNYVGDGGGVMIVEELMNAKVGNIPARLSIKKSPTGRISSELMWATKTKLFTLTVLGDVPDDSKSKYNLIWLTQLAADIREPASR
jgi:hypothetical protein